MTNLEELKRLAEAAKNCIPFAAYMEHDPELASNLHAESGMPVGSLTSEAHARFIIAANPSAILSLIERVERAESSRVESTALRQDITTMFHAAKFRYEQAEKARTEAYQRGMEDAAKVADQAEVSAMLDYGASLADVQKVAVEIAQAIREKAKASAVVWQNPTSWSRESTDGVLYIERMAGQKSPWKAFMAGELIGQGKTEDEAKALCQKAKAGKQGEG